MDGLANASNGSNGDTVPEIDDLFAEEMDFDEALVYPLTEEIHAAADDEALALRKALLGLIALVHEDATPGVAALIRYLLLAFPPLVGHLDDEGRHPFVLGEDVLVAAGSDGEPAPHFHERLVRRLYRDAWERRVQTTFGDRLPGKVRDELQALLDEQFGPRKR